jgi:hypothetical protein
VEPKFSTHPPIVPDTLSVTLTPASVSELLTFGQWLLFGYQSRRSANGSTIPIARARQDTLHPSDLLT